MGHRESGILPFVPLCRRAASQMPTTGQTSSGGGGGRVVCCRDNVPVPACSARRRAFGVPLEQLVIAGHSGVPRVVARLCHFIERHGLQTEGLFRTPGSQRCIARMRADFDTYGDCNLERYKDVNAAGGCLKMFLRELPVAVIPSRHTAEFVNAQHEDGQLSQRCRRLSALVHALPPPHYALLRYLCSFLRRVTNFHCAAQMSADTLGIVFGPNIFRVGGDGAPCLRQQAAINRLVADLIQNYDRIFNVVGQRQRPGSAETASSTGLALESDGSASSGTTVKQRVDRSIHAALTSHLLSGVTSQTGDESRDRSGEPPRKRLEDDAVAIHTGSFDNLFIKPHRPVCPDEERYLRLSSGGQCVRRTSSHDNVRDCTQAHLPASVSRSRSSHVVAPETEPIPVPFTTSITAYEPPTPWSPVSTEDGVDDSSSSSPSSSSECGDTPPECFEEAMCRHEQQRETERLASFPRSRDKTPRSRDVRRRRHSRGDGKDTPPSCTTPDGRPDQDAIPPLDLDNMSESEPISSTVLKGRQLTDDEVILSPRSSFILADAEALTEKLKRFSRFTEHALSPGPDAPDLRSQRLRRIIASAKKRIRAYEESFESKYGYRPSHADKQKNKEMKRCMADLSKARRELKQLKQEPTAALSVPESGAAGRTPEKENRTPPPEDTDTGSPTLGQTVAEVTKRLGEKRLEAGRPEAADTMSRQQVLDEKLALQKALLYLENLHGRPTEKQDRDLVRPLYERYRAVKRLIVKSGSPKMRDSIGELAPILEHETMSFSSSDRTAICGEPDEPELQDSPPDGPSERLQLDDNLHNLPASELKEQLKKAKEEKRRLRTVLLVFEENFRCNVGKKVPKDSRGDMDETYSEYKQVKAKVKLLEVLVAKSRSRSFSP